MEIWPESVVTAENCLFLAYWLSQNPVKPMEAFLTCKLYKKRALMAKPKRLHRKPTWLFGGPNVPLWFSFETPTGHEVGVKL